MIRKLFGLATLIAGLALSEPAWSHAHLVSADPLVGANTSPIDTLKLTFSEGIELPFSKVTVTGADGKDVGATKLTADPADKAIVTVTLPAPLAPGDYTVRWEVVSVDTHRTHGDFPITVKP